MIQSDDFIYLVVIPGKKCRLLSEALNYTDRHPPLQTLWRLSEVVG